jgi:hypothetical protein
LILGGGRNLAIDSQVRQKGLHLGSPHIFWVTFAMKQGEPFRPMDILVLRTQAIVLDTHLAAQLVQQLGRWRGVCWHILAGEVCHKWTSLWKDCVIHRSFE